MLLPFDTNSVAAEIEEIDRWRVRLYQERRPLSRRWSGRLRRDLEAQSVQASTAMEGVAVTVDDVRRILAGDPPREVSRQDAALVLGYREAMTYVSRRADDPNFIWNRELAVAVHDRVLAGEHEAGAGRMRSGSSRVADRRTDRTVFLPPGADEVPELVDGLLGQLTEEELHPAVSAAWLHVALAAVHPFRDGNGRTARVLTSLVMFRGGFRSPTFTSLEEWWGHHPEEYYRAFACLGDRFDSRADVTPFIEAHVNAQLAQVRALDLREREQRGLWVVVENVLDDLGLPPRLANAAWDAFFGFTVASGSYRGYNDVSPATATADLRHATVAGLLTASGQTRGRTYRAGERLFRLLARELHLDEGAATGRLAIIDELTRRVTKDEPAQPSLLARRRFAESPGPQTAQVVSADA